MKRLEIEKTLGIPAEEVLTKQHNLWIGVSSSVWFRTEGNLERLVEWALAHTREKLLVWIPGRLYAVNVNHIDKKSRAQALRKGYAEQQRFEERVAAAVSTRDPEERRRVVITNYDSVLTPTLVRRRSLFYRAFSEEGEFYRRVMEVTEDVLRARGRTITPQRTEAAAIFLLQELAMFISPLTTNDDPATSYTAELYPGIGKVDQLARDLVEGDVLPALTEKLALETTEGFGVVSVALREEP